MLHKRRLDLVCSWSSGTEGLFPTGPRRLTRLLVVWTPDVRRAILISDDDTPQRWKR